MRSDESDRPGGRESSELDLVLLRASADALLDPQVLVEAATDSAGRITDFVFREVNTATCDYLGMSRDELIGRGVVQTMPGIGETLLGEYIRCLDTGEPLVLDDFSYDNEVLRDTRRYDIRVTRTTPTTLTLTWRDVTQRYNLVRGTVEKLHQQNEQIAAAEVTFRLLAENAVDVVCHIRDGRFVWMSPSVEAVLGAPPEHWLGREVSADVPPEDLAEHFALMATVVGGGAIRHRGRVIGVDGVAHWFDLRAKPFIDAGGRPDGVTATLRLVDNEVAAEQAAEEARRLQARAEAIYRRSMEGAAIGMALIDAAGHVIDVNESLCEFFGYDAEALKQKTWHELTAPAYLEVNRDKIGDVLEGRLESFRMLKQYIHADGHLIWGDLSVSCVRDELGAVTCLISQITDVTTEVQSRAQLEAARAQQAATDARYRRSIDNAAVGMCLVTPEGRLHDANDALCQFFGREAEALNGRNWQDFAAPEYLDEELNNADAIRQGRSDSYRMLKHYRHADGHTVWGDFAVSAVRDDTGDVEYFVVMITDVTARIEAERAAADAGRERADADRRFRQLMYTAAVGMCISEPSGRFESVNDAMCRFFGYDAESLKQMTWQELTAPDYLDAELDNVAKMADGQIDSYRMTKQFIHADGHLIWGDLSVSCLRDRSSGAIEKAIGQIIDVTAEVEGRHLLARRNEENLVLARSLLRQTERLTSDLRSAAAYVESILPVGLDGRVQVSSRYLPSQELAGDCFDYRWVDDDHLIVYLIDVSGHGIEPALLSISVHNMLRAGALPLKTLLVPDKVLAELNGRFQMDDHGEHYFTMWFGVYEASTRTLRCASAGAPPAFAFAPEGGVTPTPDLSTNCAPIGMFTDTVFTSSTYPIPPGCRILLYSDGACEFDLDDGQRLSMDDFEDLTIRYASAPGSTLDGLIRELRALAAVRSFEDDCSLIEMTFP